MKSFIIGQKNNAMLGNKSFREIASQQEQNETNIVKLQTAER
jgi:hypothetical protein